MRRGRPYRLQMIAWSISTAYSRWIRTTQSRSTLKMRGFEPSDDLDFENGFFQKCYQLRSFFLRAFLPSSRWPRDTVNMQSIELVAILVGLSYCQNFFLGPLGAPKEPPGSGKSSVHAPSSPRSSSKQNDCIFTMDYVAPSLPTP